MIAALLLMPAALAAQPFSFVYGGRASAELLPHWQREAAAAGNRREVS